jgi:hypothetical protein
MYSNLCFLTPSALITLPRFNKFCRVTFRKALHYVKRKKKKRARRGKLKAEIVNKQENFFRRKKNIKKGVSIVAVNFRKVRGKNRENFWKITNFLGYFHFDGSWRLKLFPPSNHSKSHWKKRGGLELFIWELFTFLRVETMMAKFLNVFVSQTEINCFNFSP